MAVGVELPWNRFWRHKCGLWRPCLDSGASGVVWGFVCVLIQATKACDKLSVSGTMYQKAREGTYSRMNHQCYGRDTYEQQHGDNYLFFTQTHETTEGWQGWMIGTSLCENKAGIAAESHSRAPHNVTVAWEEVKGGNWTYSFGLLVECQKISATTVVGIIAAVLIFGSLLSLTFIKCKNRLKKSRTPAPRSQPSRQRPQVSTVSGGGVRPTPAPGQVQPYQRGAGGLYAGPVAPSYPRGMVRPPAPHNRPLSPPPAYTPYDGVGPRGDMMTIGLAQPPPYASLPEYSPRPEHANSPRKHEHMPPDLPAVAE